MDKLKLCAAQMTGHGSMFTISRDLLDRKLSEFVEIEKSEISRKADAARPRTETCAENLSEQLILKKKNKIADDILVPVVAINKNYYEDCNNHEMLDSCIKMLGSDEGNDKDKVNVVIPSKGEESMQEPPSTKQPIFQFESLRQRQSIVNSTFVEMNPFDLEANEVSMISCI